MTANAIDVSPLIPLVNDFIQYVIVPAAGLAITAASAALVQLMMRHGLLKNQQQAQIVADRISGLADRVVTYNAQKLEAMLPDKLIVNTPNHTVATLANYAIAQAPDLLSKGGMNPETADGQARLVRLITARLDAPPPAAPDLNVKVS